MDEAKGNYPITYTQVTALLLSAADTYDKQHSTNRMVPRNNQNVFNSDNIIDDDEEFHIDTYLSNVVARKPPIKLNDIK
jgi:hypothetical protein